MKTDLQKILAITGEQGLFTYVSQARNGMIAESMLTGRRSVFGPHAKVSSLSDISIYTEDGETPLKDVLLKMKEALGEAEAPDSKSPNNVLEDFFGKVLPGYDSDRFYPSHMKKVVGWYNILKKYASLDFEDEEEKKEEEPKEEK
ncbi:MAG TPA: DUF5606 domain-containing protein [Candidatus Coprenecus stercoravium]|uniref:DUF5606 domain-containing protein n=1 Tax=Candidatus Coprenecus stercoravium TaxID=2840735 RepID=A0A9D2GNL1_9BACT|nr:DUF5606 domain-containing protein [Candidatus Coprenecus stercoravium]